MMMRALGAPAVNGSGVQRPAPVDGCSSWRPQRKKQRREPVGLEEAADWGSRSRLQPREAQGQVAPIRYSGEIPVKLLWILIIR